ncbi:MAG: RHS repeat-associated core domain-containing protein [Pseudomonadales bacterium]|nr:RHS repeat-associated core domain-containing protein [Pseudomonadales bacterium]
MTLYSETRLTQVMDGPTGTPIETDAYDATGNRTALTNAGNTTAYSYPIDSHRLSSVGGQNRTYDAGGNTLTIGGNGRRFVYDNSGRMTQVKAGGIVMRQYQYNAKGEQTRAYLDADSAYFVHDEAGHLLGEYDASGSPKQQILWFGDLPVGVLQGSGASQQLHYIEPDHLGTPRVIIDGQRNVPIWTWSNIGEAFGASPPEQDPDRDGQSFTFDLRFPGQRYDNATGLNYNYFRDYDPATGRYVESDPIGLNGGISTFAYSDSRSLNLVDPSGLCTYECNNSKPPHHVAIKSLVAMNLINRLLNGNNAGAMVASYEVQDIDNNPVRGVYFVQEHLSIPARRSNTNNWTQLSFSRLSDTHDFYSPEEAIAYRLQNVLFTVDQWFSVKDQAGCLWNLPTVLRHSFQFDQNGVQTDGRSWVVRP